MTSNVSMARGLAALGLAAGLMLVSGAAFAEKIGNCDVTGKAGEFHLKPAHAGVLTVETNLPGPGWFNGDTPDAVKDGYEYCMAATIAYRTGLKTVKVVNVAWDALVTGQTKNYDLALSQISITAGRKKVVDFSVPYFSSNTGILVKKGTKLDAASMKTARIGVQQGTTGATFVADTLKPANFKVFPDAPSLFTALIAGQIDAAMTDTAIILGQAANAHGMLKVIGQYSTGEVYGAIYPKGSTNDAVINKIITQMKDDGTLRSLSAKYLAGAWGLDPSTIPYFKP